MNNCVHQWIYIGSKRQDVWRCIFCDEYKINDSTQKREWQGLTDEEVDALHYYVGGKWSTTELVRHVEVKLKEKNSV